MSVYNKAHTIVINGKNFSRFLDQKEVQGLVRKIGKKISHDCKKKSPVFLCVLNGSFMFAADLVRCFPYPCEVSFVKLSSYRGDKSSEVVTTLIGLNENLKGKTVVVVEDIVDSGTTLSFLVREIKKHHPREIFIAALFYKLPAGKKQVKIDYRGKKIPDRFIVGYGLDYNGTGRNLKHIYVEQNVKQKKRVC